MKFIVSILLLASFAHAEIVDRVVAIVNKSIVTESDIQKLRSSLRGNGLIDESLLSLYDSKAILKNRSEAISFLVDSRVIDSEVERQGLVAPIEQVESEIRKIARSRGFSKDQLVASLKRDKLRYSDYQSLIKTGLERQSLLQREVTSKIKISDDDINSFYISNYKQGKALVFEYTLAHIVFLDKNGGRSATKERAREVHTRLTKGADFESIAAQHSEDPEYAHGGLFGTFRVTDFNKDVRDSISKLNEGDISTPVAMPDGVHIFKVLKRTLVPSPELEARKEEIRQRLTAENFRRYYQAWIDRKRREAYIKYN